MSHQYVNNTPTSTGYPFLNKIEERKDSGQEESSTEGLEKKKQRIVPDELGETFTKG